VTDAMTAFEITSSRSPHCGMFLVIFIARDLALTFKRLKSLLFECGNIGMSEVRDSIVVRGKCSMGDSRGWSNHVLWI
jgi:hypothetical protein